MASKLISMQDLNKAGKLPSARGRVVTVPLSLLPAYLQIHNIEPKKKPDSYIYIGEPVYDHVLIVKRKDE